MRILIVDDETNIRMTLKDILEDEGYEVSMAGTGEKAVSFVSKENVDMVILDVKLPGIDGIEAFKQIHKNKPSLDVLMISGHSDISTAVNAVKFGAYDFLEKPLSMIKILTAVRNIEEKLSLKTKVALDESVQHEKYRFVGNSPQVKNVLKLVEKVAPTESKVLIRGESGAGKELIAYAIHHGSDRQQKPFIKFNSAAIPESLVESELFGHEKGAFTGADSQKLGKLEQANHGTLFLDEIGDMDLSVQAKVLRVIQEGTFERVGGNKTINIDVRLIAATHKNLEEMVGAIQSSLEHHPIMSAYGWKIHIAYDGLEPRVVLRNEQNSLRIDIQSTMVHSPSRIKEISEKLADAFQTVLPELDS